MNQALKRSLLRWIHLLFGIPILGYVYSPASELPQYAPLVRFVAVPVIVFSGYGMFAGLPFAILGLVLWLGTIQLAGVGAALLVQAALFLVRKTWLVIRRGRPNDRIRPKAGEIL